MSRVPCDGGKRTELPESSHVGEHGLDVHADDSLGDLLDSVDNLLSAHFHMQGEQ